MKLLSAPSTIAAAGSHNPEARNWSGHNRRRAVALICASPARPGGVAHDRRGCDRSEAGNSRSAAPSATYPMAPFLTHLIVTAQGIPQTRSQRRAEPDRAISAYAATSREPMRAGTALRQYH